MTVDIRIRKQKHQFYPEATFIRFPPGTLEKIDRHTHNRSEFIRQAVLEKLQRLGQPIREEK